MTAVTHTLRRLRGSRVLTARQLPRGMAEDMEVQRLPILTLAARADEALSAVETPLGKPAAFFASFTILATKNSHRLNIFHTNPGRCADHLIRRSIFSTCGDDVISDRADKSVVVTKTASSADAVREALIYFFNGQK